MENIYIIVKKNFGIIFCAHLFSSASTCTEYFLQKFGSMKACVSSQNLAKHFDKMLRNVIAYKLMVR